MENLLPKNIKLFNRDGADMWLVYNNDDNYYYFVTTDYFYNKYWSVHTNPNNPDEIIAVDPSGGPFMAIGEYIDDKLILTKIEDNPKGGFKFYIEYEANKA